MAGVKIKHFLPNYSKADWTQLIIFLTLFILICLASLSQWIGDAFFINNGFILVVCFFTIGLPPDAKIYYLFSYALLPSAVLDLIAISLNYNATITSYSALNFFFGFPFIIFLMIAKPIIFLQQLAIAKDLNGEPPIPIDLNKLFSSKSSKKSSSPAPAQTSAPPVVGNDVESAVDVVEQQQQQQQSEQQHSKPHENRSFDAGDDEVEVKVITETLPPNYVEENTTSEVADVIAKVIDNVEHTSTSEKRSDAKNTSNRSNASQQSRISKTSRTSKTSNA